MYHLIYQITDKINGKIYIGKHQSVVLKDSYFGSGKILNVAIKKYGIENFVKTILHQCSSEEEMNLKEKEIVNAEFCQRKDTYNLNIGGEGGWGYCNSNPVFKARKIVRCRLAGAKHCLRLKEDKLYRERCLAAFRLTCNGVWPFSGKKHSEETKAKMRKSSIGKSAGERNSQFGSVWITNGVNNRKISKTEMPPIGWKTGRTCSKTV